MLDSFKFTNKQSPMFLTSRVFQPFNFLSTLHDLCLIQKIILFLWEKSFAHIFKILQHCLYDWSAYDQAAYNQKFFIQN